MRVHKYLSFQSNLFLEHDTSNSIRTNEREKRIKMAMIITIGISWYRRLIKRHKIIPCDRLKETHDAIEIRLFRDIPKRAEKERDKERKIERTKSQAGSDEGGNDERARSDNASFDFRIDSRKRALAPERE